jgi:hypothetical protein
MIADVGGPVTIAAAIMRSVRRVVARWWFFGWATARRIAATNVVRWPPM